MKSNHGFSRTVVVLIGILWITAGLAVVRGQDKQNSPKQPTKDKIKLTVTLCPASLAMQFGGYYYYDCFNLDECGGTHSHLLAGDVRPHTIGCVDGDPDSCDSISGAFIKDKEKKDTVHRTGEKVNPIPRRPVVNEDDVRATIYHGTDVTSVEQFAKFNGRWYRVIKVLIPGAPQTAIVAHECGRPASAIMTLTESGHQVTIDEPAAGFSKNEPVDIIITGP